MDCFRGCGLLRGPRGDSDTARPILNIARRAVMPQNTSASLDGGEISALTITRSGLQCVGRSQRTELQAVSPCFRDPATKGGRVLAETRGAGCPAEPHAALMQWVCGWVQLSLSMTQRQVNTPTTKANITKNTKNVFLLFAFFFFLFFFSLCSCYTSLLHSTISGGIIKPTLLLLLHATAWQVDPDLMGAVGLKVLTSAKPASH
jgi:hypothetical protein